MDVNINSTKQRIDDLVRMLVSGNDIEQMLQHIYDFLVLFVNLSLDAFPDKAENIKFQLQNRLTDVHLYAEVSSPDLCEAQSRAFAQVAGHGTVEIERLGDERTLENNVPIHYSNSSEGQPEIPIGLPSKDASLAPDASGHNKQGSIHHEVTVQANYQQGQRSLVASKESESAPFEECPRNDQSHEKVHVPVQETTQLDGATIAIQSNQSEQQTPTRSVVLTTSLDKHQPSLENENIRYEDQGGVLRLLPTEEQYQRFPDLIHFAEKLGARETGAVKILVPNGSTRFRLSHPSRELKVLRNRFSIKPYGDGTFQVARMAEEAHLPSISKVHEAASTEEHVQHFESLLQNPDWFYDVDYYVDLEARSKDQRCRLGLPPESPIFPLKGNRLSETKAIISGIHTPYVYWSGPKFGAPFAMHVEDCQLSSINYLYSGEKIWFVIEPRHLEGLEEQLGELRKRTTCSQFLRHRAEYLCKASLDRWGVSYKLVRQTPNEVVYTYPGAYHQGFSAGSTVAEAVNFAGEDWTTDGYQFCSKGKCPRGSVMADMMGLCDEGEIQYDLTQETEQEEQQQEEEEEENILNKDEGKGKEKARPKGRDPILDKNNSGQRGKKRKLKRRTFSEKNHKRRATALTRHVGIQETALPPKFITPEEFVINLAQKNLDQKHFFPISWYFFNIASPQAFVKLQEACTALRNHAMSQDQDSVDETQRAMKLLDGLDNRKFALMILRRYYLHRLVQCRDKAVTKYQNGKSTRDCAKVSSDRYTTLALDEMMRHSYPKLTKNKGDYESCRKSLQNRISHGRNWDKLVEAFGSGILALVPVSEESPNSVFERLPNAAVDYLIKFLDGHRGEFLRPVSKLIGSHLLDVVGGKEQSPKYRFEREGHDLSKMVIDSPRLLELCSVEGV